MIVTPKKPPPANNDTERRNGFSRVQKLNCVSIDSSMNGTLKFAPRLMFVSANTPTARSGIDEIEAGLDALGGHVEVRRVAEPVERDDLLQRVDERERPRELDAVRVGELHVHVRLLAGHDRELDDLEVQDQELRRRDQLQVER